MNGGSGNFEMSLVSRYHPTLGKILELAWVTQTIEQFPMIRVGR